MKLLLDENLPHQLRHEIAGHDCVTVAYMGWAGIENGELLNYAASAGFDVLLTKDEGLDFEHNPVNLPVGVVILHAPSNKLIDIRPLLPALLEALSNLAPRQVVHVR